VLDYYLFIHFQIIMQKAFILSFMCFFAFFQAVFSQTDHMLTKSQVEEALRSGGKYLVTTLLDDEGKSRCDYNLSVSRWEPFEVPWHTGQAINAMVNTSQILRDKDLLAKAVQSGNWWISLEIKDHPKLNGMIKSIHGADMGETIVYSTCTDGTPGLFELTKATGDRKFAEIAGKAGIWLHSNMWDPVSGLSYDCVNPVTGEVMKTWSAFWKDKKVQTLTDVARPNVEGFLFLDMYRYTGKEEYKKWFMDQLDILVKTQGPDGLWMDFTPNNKAESSVHPRFNLWYAEALMKGFELTGKASCLEAALKVARFYQSIQTEDGTIYYKNYTNGKKPGTESVCGSAVSLAGIVWLQLIKAGKGEEFIPSVEKSAKWIFNNRFSEQHADPNLRGAFVDTRQSSKKGVITIINRDLGTIFGLRFLCDYHEYLNH
jgi:uncharacterized protein YyaL (SSP411 family)